MLCTAVAMLMMHQEGGVQRKLQEFELDCPSATASTPETSDTFNLAFLLTLFCSREFSLIPREALTYDRPGQATSSPSLGCQPYKIIPLASSDWDAFQFKHNFYFVKYFIFTIP